MNPGTDAHSESPTPETGPSGGTELPVTGVFVPTGAGWHGITWEDVPGKDEDRQKLKFTLLKRGMLRGHEGCAQLHGEALKQRLLEIYASHCIDPATGRKKKDPQRPIARMKARKRRKPP